LGVSLRAAEGVPRGLLGNDPVAKNACDRALQLVLAKRRGGWNSELVREGLQLDRVPILAIELLYGHRA
jgi:hypothetical protein